MTLETLPFDATKYLASRRSQAELIADALESGDAATIAAALGVVARARGMAEVAREAGVTRASLYKALSEKGDPQLTTLLGVIKALGLKLTVAGNDNKARRNAHRNAKGFQAFSEHFQGYYLEILYLTGPVARACSGEQGSE
jgi:probable addiction module antidote protein